MNLREVLDAAKGLSDRVNFAAQIKWSAEYQDKNYEPDDPYKGVSSVGGVQRLTVSADKSAFDVELVTAATYPDDEFLDGAAYPLYKPANLAAFLKWGKQTFNTEHYILVFWNHGSGWTPWFDGYMAEPVNSGAGRAVIHDDNGDERSRRAMSAFEQRRALELAGFKIDVVYYDACLMGMLEVLGELKASGNVDYFLGTGHVTAGIGGDYGALLRLLDNPGLAVSGRDYRTELEQVIARYCELTMAHWNMYSSVVYGDIIFAELSKLDAVFGVIKRAAAWLTRLAEEDNPGMEYITGLPVRLAKDEGGVCFLNNYDLQAPEPEKAFVAMINGEADEDEDGVPDKCAPFVDIYSYLQWAAATGCAAELVTLASDLHLAIDNAIIYRAGTDSLPALSTFGVSLVNKDRWESYGYETTGHYKSLEFDQATGWSAWLSHEKNTTRFYAATGE